MKAAVAIFVGLGLALAGLLGYAVGLDWLGVVLLIAIAGAGATAVIVAGKFESGQASPAQCRACGGLISPNSPYCKHCGTPV